MGLAAVSSRTERVIEIGSTGLTTQLARAVDLADGMGNKLVASGLQAAAHCTIAEIPAPAQPLFL